MTAADNTEYLRRSAAARHLAAMDRAQQAVRSLDRAGEAITFAAVARAARVSRGWLYRHAKLRDAIIELRQSRPVAVPAAPAAERATAQSLRERLDHARAEIGRLRTENAALRDQVARLLGEKRSRS